MNEEYLMSLLGDVRRCPFDCGWVAERRLKSSHLQKPLWKVPAFIERCRGDLADHLVAAHRADPEDTELSSSAAALGGQESQAAGSAPARSEEAGAGATSSEGEGQ